MENTTPVPLVEEDDDVEGFRSEGENGLPCSPLGLRSFRGKIMLFKTAEAQGDGDLLCDALPAKP